MNPQQREYIGEGTAVIPFEDISRHMYSCSAPGTGKSTLIRILAKGLEEANQTGEFRSAFIYLDPKGDDSFKFLSQVEALDQEKVTFLDPVLTNFSVNPLELPTYKEGERERIVSVYTGFLMSIIHEWYGANPQFAPRMIRIMRSLISYLYHKSDAPTLIDFFDIVVRMQKKDDPTLIQDISDTLSAGEAEMMKREMEAIAGLKSEAFDPVLTRLSEFATDPFLRRLFSVRRSSVDFSRLLEDGHVTIIRVAGHEVGSHIAPLIMAVVVLKVWFSVQERAQRLRSEKDRIQIVLGLDEFQDIQDLQAIDSILAQARSFGLGLLLSHQSTAQLDEKKLKIILSNCAVQGAGRVSGDDAARIASNWDPQYKKEIVQTLTTQADFRWSFRFRAEPGKEASPPLMNVPLGKPPEEKHSWEEVQAFIEEQKTRYGHGVVERPLLAQQEKAGTEWMEHSMIIPVPSKEDWAVLLDLRERSLNVMKIAEETGIGREEVAAMIKGLRSRGQVKVAYNSRAGVTSYALTEEGYNILPGLELIDYEKIGGPDAQDLAVKAVRYCLEKKWFVALAIQDPSMKRRVDCVAFDYSTNTPIAIEVESEEHVWHDHPDQLKQHLLKIEPFKEMIIVTRKGKAERKALELRSQLSEEQQKRVTVLAFDWTA